ncbi:MAG: hypothetical protein ACR2OA_20105 [Rubripirellula sp.]
MRFENVGGNRSTRGWISIRLASHPATVPLQTLCYGDSRYQFSQSETQDWFGLGVHFIKKATLAVQVQRGFCELQIGENIGGSHAEVPAMSC